MKTLTHVLLLTAVLLSFPVDTRSQVPDSALMPDRVGHHSCIVQTSHSTRLSAPLDSSRFFVVPDPGTEGSAHSLIADALMQLGFAVTVGDLENMPDYVDVVVHSRSDWVWDFSTYLHALIIMFRDPTTNELIGVADFSTFDHSTSKIPENVMSTVQDLLTLFDDPEAAPPC